MACASGRRPSVAVGTPLRVAALTAAGVIGLVARAEAAVDFWHGSDPGYYQPFQLVQPPRRQKVRRSAPKKDATAAAKETSANPQGPLIIAVSIAKQRVKIYDDKGVFAEAPVSTGMPGHPTPMGVFSVIQKHKFHHSNIYSDAPMPYMQRITWSGVAMHAGVLPGYPASHGCIRVPMAFAVKMWNWTKMGTRVFVTPGEIAMPASFAHPFLPTLRVAPPATVAELPPVQSHADVKADKGAPTPAEVKLELRSTVGDNGRLGAADAPASRETRTQEAAVKSTVTMSDAQVGPAREAKPEALEAATAESRSDELKVAEARSTETRSDANPAIADNPDKAETEPDQPMVAAKADGDDASPERPANAFAEAAPPKREDAANAAEAKPAPELDALSTEHPSKAVEVNPQPAKSESEKPEAAKAEAADLVGKVGDRTKIAGNAPAGPAAVAKKDQTRLSETERPPAAKPEPPKRTGQIAVFISRKDSKLYVRQNFEPLFQVPVTIASSDRPLGTHVFTAEVDKTDTNVLRWSVVSLPMLASADDLERVSSRRHRGATPPPVEAKRQPVQVSPSEALDRITVAQDAMTRIAEALASGASIIVSDQGINQGETGEGTDFIVRLH
jgi:lipoprotein-anchoring transpeptidase ErfK/SrfK